MKIDQLTNAEKAAIFRREAAHQCDLARAWYDQGSNVQGDAAMDNAAALMRIAADCEQRRSSTEDRSERPHHD